MKRPERGLLLHFLVLAGLAFASQEVHAARLPEWAQAVAESAPALDEAVSEQLTRVLLDETHISVAKDGTFTTRWRYASQALSSKVSRIDIQDLPWQEGRARVGRTRAWHLPLGDRAKKSSLPPVDVTLSENLLSDVRHRIVAVTGIERGSIVFFEFEVDESPLDLAVGRDFGRGAQTLLKRLEIDLPSPEWTVRAEWLRQPGPEASIEGTLWRWELKDLPAIEREPLGLPMADTTALFWANPRPPPDSKVRPLVFVDWRALATWYGQLIKGREMATPETAGVAKNMLASAGPAFADRVRALSHKVRDSVRYVAKAVGAGNLQPRPAGEVLSQLYGDCKDKATLLRSLLGSAGFTSYPILINATRRETVAADVPAVGAFDHFVTGIAVPEDAAIPSWMAPAVVDAGELGRLMIVDATNPYAATGTMPVGLSTRKALVVAGPQSVLIEMPAPTARDHRIDADFRFEARSDGSLAVEAIERRIGEPAAAARSDFRASSAERRKAIEHRFREVFLRAEQFRYEADVETLEGAFIEKTSWVVPPSKPGSPLEVPVFLDAGTYLKRASLSQRKTPVAYSFPLAVRCGASLVGLPDSAELPASEDRRGEGWSVSVRSAREDGVVRAEWEMVLDRTRFDPPQTDELRKLWGAVSRTGKATLSLPQ